MRKTRFLLPVAFVLLWISGATAQNAALKDGTIVEQTPCAPSPVRTYEQYVEAFTRFATREVAAAQREGFHVEMPTDMAPQLVSREEFERHRAPIGAPSRGVKRKLWLHGCRNSASRTSSSSTPMTTTACHTTELRATGE
jgi:hypothetical protein